MSKFKVGQRVWMTQSPSLKGVVEEISVLVTVPDQVNGRCFKARPGIGVEQKNNGVLGLRRNPEDPAKFSLHSIEVCK
jgi:hypothetical protein